MKTINIVIIFFSIIYAINVFIMIWTVLKNQSFIVKRLEEIEKKLKKQ